jgi:hypothetical protein
MDESKAIEALTAEWERPAGFLGRLREGVFDEAGYRRLQGILNSVEIADERLVQRRLVSLLWYIPTFMAWQRERVQESNGDVTRLDAAVTEVQNLLESVLGVP